MTKYTKITLSELRKDFAQAQKSPVACFNIMNKALKANNAEYCETLHTLAKELNISKFTFETFAGYMHNYIATGTDKKTCQSDNEILYFEKSILCKGRAFDFESGFVGINPFKENTVNNFLNVLYTMHKNARIEAEKAEKAEKRAQEKATKKALSKEQKQNAKVEKKAKEFLPVIMSANPDLTETAAFELAKQNAKTALKIA